MIKEVFISTFEKHIWVRYLKELSFQPSTDTLYENALSYLNSGDTEKSISYIILTLDADPNHIPVQHLGRSMLFSLTDEFIKRKGPSVKEKFPDLNKYLISLEQKLTKMEKEFTSNQNNLSKLEAKLNEGFSISSFFNKKNNLNQISQIKEENNKINHELPKLKREVYKVSDLCKIEEYVKVITLVLEIIAFPRRYS